MSLRLRHSVRGLVIDDLDCVLLYRFLVPHEKLAVWTPPGGGVEVGESLLEALARELDEEIGLQLSETPLHVWHQRVEDSALVSGYDGVINDYYLIRSARFAPRGSLDAAALSLELVGNFDWWSVDRLRSYRGADVFGPRDLPHLVADLVDGNVSAAPIPIGL